MNSIKNILRAALVAGLMIFSGSVYAQQKMTVSGTVKDSKGEPVIGAAVLVEGTTNGVVTDVNGKYSITFTPKAGTSPKLNISSIAYITEIVEVKNRGVIDVTLQDDAEQLNEVVVVGYGSVRRSDLTGSVTSVKIDESEAAQSGSLDQLLQGHAAGVQVVSNSAAPDAGVSVTIRGASSFNANSQPLYVVDGVIMNTSTGASLGSHAGADGSGTDEETNGLMGISPQDIASMEILKDASATAIYGSQGANGVILITTKTANREKPVVTFSAGVDFSNIYKKFDLLTAETYPLYLDAKGVQPTADAYLYYTERIENGQYIPVDWQDYATRVGVSQRYYMSVAGRPKNSNYRLSIGYTDNQGIIKGTGYKNLTSRLNYDKKIGNFSIGTKNSVSYFKSSMTQGLGGNRAQASSSMVYSMLMTKPVKFIGQYDDEGLELDDEGAPLSGPERWLTDYESTRNELRITPSVYAQYKILPWLTFKSTFGADLRVTEQNKFRSNRLTAESVGSNGTSLHTERLNWNWDNLLMFDKKWNKHYITGTLGQSASAVSTKTQSVEGTNIEQWKDMAMTLNNAPLTYLTYGEDYSQLMSFFGRIVYSYADRYVLTATYRFDGSSKFAGKNKWAQFPSLAFAWRINQEPWFNVPVISSAKLRLGWGMVGNQGIPSYQTIYRYSTAAYPTHETSTYKALASYSQNLPSYDLKWESTSQFNVVLDLGFWKGRLSLEADWYHKTTNDLLQTKTLGGSSGVSNPYVNMGSILNTGFEFTINATPVISRDFEWNIGANLSLNRNKILSIDPSGTNTSDIYIYRDQPIQTVEWFKGSDLSNGTICRDYINIFIAGYPMGLFSAMPTDGLVPLGKTGVPLEASPTVERGPGSINYIDTNGDGLISALDRCIVGDPNPDFTYGFNTSFRWKKFTLSANFIGSYGNDIYNQQAMILTYTTSNTNNMLTDVITNTWTPERQNAKYPALDQFSATDTNWATDIYVEDGSYLRLANVTLSYDVPFKNKNFFIKGLNIGVTGKNLYVWTKFSGYDPDVNSYNNVMKRGVDSGAYPSARAYLLDLKFTF